MDVVGSSPENRHLYTHTPALDGYEITMASWGYLIERAGKLSPASCLECQVSWWTSYINFCDVENVELLFTDSGQSDRAKDRRERVPYVVVYGTPDQPLIQLVKRPEDLLDNPGLRLNGVYYASTGPLLSLCLVWM